eukprot:TRINITY_DN188_c0_g1_i1.p1 TRINITY_DN188_c0_g1~~TRINITY_DN188_c0_g1_i1.p1  ORF type:complete len:448 (+),score=118.79 TRINITY_DN188_c0_g1_i1:99-1442(+)
MEKDRKRERASSKKKGKMADDASHAKKKSKKVTFHYEALHGDEYALPVIASVEGGSLNASKLEELQFRVFQRVGSERTAWQKMVRGSTDLVSYEGLTSKIPDGSSTPRFVLGIVDKRRREGRLVDVDQIVSLKPHLQRRVDKTFDHGSITSTSFQNLIQEFGSARDRRRLDIRERFAISTENMKGHDAIASRILEIASHQPTKKDLEADMEESRVLPPCNIAAESVEGIYPLADLVPENDWDELDISPFMNPSSKDLEGWKNMKTYPGFVLERLSSQKDRLLDVKARNFESQLLMYLTHMLAMYHAPPKAYAQPGVLQQHIPGASRNIVLSLLDGFSEKSKDHKGRFIRRRTPRLRDLLLEYILVFTLHIDGFRTRPALIASDLRMKIQRCVQFFLELGCVSESGRKKQDEKDGEGIIASDGAQTVVLPLPPRFPKLTTFARARKRR